MLVTPLQLALGATCANRVDISGSIVSVDSRTLLGGYRSMLMLSSGYCASKQEIEMSRLQAGFRSIETSYPWREAEITQVPNFLLRRIGSDEAFLSQ